MRPGIDVRQGGWPATISAACRGQLLHTLGNKIVAVAVAVAAAAAPARAFAAMVLVVNVDASSP
jgi:hypothetical protein